MLADNVRLPVAVGDDKGDVSVCQQIIERVESQGGLLHPAVFVVCGNSLASGCADKRYRRDVGEHAHRYPGKVLVHDFSLQPFGWNNPYGLDAWQ